ncbi:hypothetical protein [Cognatilysobacter lacus]|uniref:DinB-like domain-containing protein n=1 Tax=Cognatilysobacter lacus TaxID=1643323 RepID=A0A5D8ZAA5_9GAMM|nr:hypothetical protein [Lysobacter lacus]TZF91587.1 hypothetical protein FW784_01125 [Lysobacter lacus]
MKSSLVLAITLALAAPAAFAQHMPAPAAAAAAANVTAPHLHAALRALWHGHVVHAREYAFAVHAGNAKASKKADAAVVANAKQIAAAVGGFYGDGARRQMQQLLAGHWGAVKHITDASRAGDAAGRTRAIADLTENAKAIAAFLSGANPYLPNDAVFGLLAAHGGHHVAQIDQVMKNDGAGEAVTWSAMQKHMDTIADALAGAIAKQFPAKAT